MTRPYFYWDWCKDEAKTINSDGCSIVSELFHRCCIFHDLSYYYSKDPKSAYTYWRTLDNNGYWHLADPITRADADRQFRDCIRAKSKLGKWSPIAAIRWAAVRAFGWRAWRRHRNA